MIETTYSDLTPNDALLVDQARQATSLSYSPYSKFRVGAAALLQNGKVVCGANQENASYPVGICAERSTLATAQNLYPGVPVVALALAARNESESAFGGADVQDNGSKGKASENELKGALKDASEDTLEGASEGLQVSFCAFTEGVVSPCGMCRQALLETEMRYGQSIRIIMSGRERIKVVESAKDLLPVPFE